MSRSRARRQRRAHRERIIAALGSTGFDLMGEVYKRDESRFFSAEFLFPSLFAAELWRYGLLSNRKRIKLLMRMKGSEAIYQQPNTSLGQAHRKVCPYQPCGIHLRSDGEEVCVSGGRDGLDETPGLSLPGVEQDGRQGRYLDNIFIEHL